VKLHTAFVINNVSAHPTPKIFASFSSLQATPSIYNIAGGPKV